MAGAAAGATGGVIGTGELGYGLSMNPQMQPVQLPSNAQDQQSIQNQMLTQQGITNQGMGAQTGLNDQYMNQLMGIDSTQNSLLAQQDQNQLGNLTANLSPAGIMGQQLAGEYNNVGATPQSGAFQAQLANQYGNLLSQQQQGILQQSIGQQNQLGAAAGSGFNALTGIQGQGTDVQSGLGLGGLQRQFGLEDQATNVDLAQNLAQYGQQTALQQALVSGGGQLMANGASGGK
jgi:hypothetical protein